MSSCKLHLKLHLLVHEKLNHKFYKRVGKGTHSPLLGTLDDASLFPITEESRCQLLGFATQRA